MRTGTMYPTAEWRARVAGRSKRALGDALGLQNFGVNVVRLEPGAWSSLRHWHSRQDEFVWVLEGEVVLVSDVGEQVLQAGMCAGFPAASGDGHHLVNRSSAPAVFLEVGDRLPGDVVRYPGLDLEARGRRSGYDTHHLDGRTFASE